MNEGIHTALGAPFYDRDADILKPGSWYQPPDYIEAPLSGARFYECCIFGGDIPLGYDFSAHFLGFDFLHGFFAVDLDGLDNPVTPGPWSTHAWFTSYLSSGTTPKIGLAPVWTTYNPADRSVTVAMVCYDVGPVVLWAQDIVMYLYSFPGGVGPLTPYNAPDVTYALEGINSVPGVTGSWYSWATGISWGVCPDAAMSGFIPPDLLVAMGRQE